MVNAVKKYDSDDELIVDVSTSSLKQVKKDNKKQIKKDNKKQIKKDNKKQIKKDNKKQIKKDNKKVSYKIRTEKEILTDILNSKEYFYLIYNNIIIYDSIKNENSILVFYDDYFILNNEIYNYIGLKIKFKK